MYLPFEDSNKFRLYSKTEQPTEHKLCCTREINQIKHQHYYYSASCNSHAKSMNTCCGKNAQSLVETMVMKYVSHTHTHTCTRTHKMYVCMYEGWNFNSGNYLFTTDTK